MLKRLISVLLIMLLLVPCGSVVAAENASVKVSFGEIADIGDGLISLPVNVTENSGLIVLRLKIEYDSKVMALTDIRDSGNLGTAYHTDDLSQNPCYLYWNNPTVQSNFTYTGTVAQLIFRPMKDDISNAVVNLACDWENYDCIDFDLNAISVSVSNTNVNYQKPTNGASSEIDRNEFLNSDVSSVVSEFEINSDGQVDDLDEEPQIANESFDYKLFAVVALAVVLMVLAVLFIKRKLKK